MGKRNRTVSLCRFFQREMLRAWLLTRVTLVGVALKGIATLGDGENVLRNDLVEGEGTSAEDLAGIAVAMKILC